MNIWFKTWLLISIFIYSHHSVADPCNSGELPKALYEKLVNKDYSGAEDEAINAIKADPESKDAQINLAKVYINSALRPVVNFDFNAMGIEPGKTGVPQKINIDKLMEGASDDYQTEVEFGKKAERQINLVLKRWPESKSLLYCLTKIKFYSQDHAQFLKTLYRTAETFSDKEEEAIGYFLNYAEYYFKHREIEKSADVYKTLLRVYPKNAPLLSSLGVSYLYQGRVVDSVKLFDEAHKQSPEDKIVLGNISEISMLTGEFDKAERFLKMRARMLPDDTSIYFDLAMNSMHKGIENSLPYWDVYFDKNNEYPDEKLWINAADVIQRSIKDGKMTIEEQIGLAGQLIEDLNTPKYAVPLMSYLQKKHESDAAFPYQLSHAYDKGGYYDLEEKALLETYKRLQSKQSKYMEISLNEVLYNLARVTYAQDKTKDSLKYLDKMKKTGEEKANVGYLYGLIYIKLNEIDEARKHLELCSKASTSTSLRGSCKSQLENL